MRKQLPFKMVCGGCGATFYCSGRSYCTKKVNCQETVKTGVCTCPTCFQNSVCFTKKDYAEYYRLYLTCWDIPKNLVPLLASTIEN